MNKHKFQRKYKFMKKNIMIIKMCILLRKITIVDDIAKVFVECIKFDDFTEI